MITPFPIIQQNVTESACYNGFTDLDRQSMLQDIFGQAQRQVTTDKFYSLPVERQKELLDSLYKTIILGLRALVLEHVSIDQRDEIEIMINKQDDDALFLFGRQKIQDFDNKLQKMIDDIALGLIYDINNS